MQYKNCKHCQSRIDARAKRCPQCQGDLRPWITRHPVIFGLLVVFLGVPFMIGLLGSLGRTPSDGGGASNPAAKQTAAPVAIDLKTMIANYDSNQIAADANYKGSTVKFSGYVDNISKDFTGDPYIVINPTAEQHYYGTHVRCSVSAAEAMKTANGKPITVSGKVTGMTVGIIGVEDCVVL